MVAVKYGVLQDDGRSERAIFVIDKEGFIRYIDIHDIEEQPDNDVLIKVLEAIDPEAAERGAELEKAAAPLAPFVEPDADIVMYCTSWCPGCRRARAWFAENNIDYVEVDVTKDRMAAAQIREWNNGAETTPTFNIRGKIFANFSVAEVEKALGVKK